MAKDERTPLMARSGSQGPKPMYLAPRSNSISQVRTTGGRTTDRALAGGPHDRNLTLTASAGVLGGRGAGHWPPLAGPPSRCVRAGGRGHRRPTTTTGSLGPCVSIPIPLREIGKSTHAPLTTEASFFPSPTRTARPAGGYQNGGGGFLASLWPFGHGGHGRSQAHSKIRKAPVKVEPKVFFSNGACEMNRCGSVVGLVCQPATAGVSGLGLRGSNGLWIKSRLNDSHAHALPKCAQSGPSSRGSTCR